MPHYPQLAAFIKPPMWLPPVLAQRCPTQKLLLQNNRLAHNVLLCTVRRYLLSRSNFFSCLQTIHNGKTYSFSYFNELHLVRYTRLLIIRIKLNGYSLTIRKLLLCKLWASLRLCSDPLFLFKYCRFLSFFPTSATFLLARSNANSGLLCKTMAKFPMQFSIVVLQSPVMTLFGILLSNSVGQQAFLHGRRNEYLYLELSQGHPVRSGGTLVWST